MNAPLIVVSGPSGVGKTTVVRELLAEPGLPLRRAITATTRAPRPGETDGVDYYFWSIAKFQNEISAGKMLEYAVVHGTDYYGTPYAEVEDRSRSGVLLVIDVQGAASVRSAMPKDSISVFLMPPSYESLRERLASRGTEDPAAFARRLASAEREMQRRNEFDIRVINEDLTETVKALRAIIHEQLTLRGGTHAR